MPQHDLLQGRMNPEFTTTKSGKARTRRDPAIKLGDFPFERSIADKLIELFVPPLSPYRCWDDLDPIHGWVARSKRWADLYRVTERPVAIRHPHTWESHLAGMASVLPIWYDGEWNTFMLGIDHHITGEDGVANPFDFAALPAHRKAALVRPWLFALQDLENECGESLSWLIYESGFKGFWIAIFLDEIATVSQMTLLRGALIERAEYHEAPMGPVPPPGFLHQLPCDSNLSLRPCRIPFAIHQHSKRLALILDPQTGEYEPDQFGILVRLGHTSSLEALTTALQDEPASPQAVAPTPAQATQWSVRQQVAKARSAQTADPQSTGSYCIGRIETGMGVGSKQEDVFIDLPMVIPPGDTYASLVLSGALGRLYSRSLKEKGYIDQDSLLQEIRKRMVGDPDHLDRRMGDVVRIIRSDMRGIHDGSSFYHGGKTVRMTGEEVDRCGELADGILGTYRGNRKPRRQDIVDVLCLVALKSQGNHLTMTHDHAIRRLEWVEPETPQGGKRAENARKRLTSILDLFRADSGRMRTAQPLLTRKTLGGSNSSSAWASVYEIHWAHWGGAFLGRAGQDAAAA